MVKTKQYKFEYTIKKRHHCFSKGWHLDVDRRFYKEDIVDQ